MADVTGSIGNEYVELNNAATEATLKQLLQAVQKQGGAGAAGAVVSGAKLLKARGGAIRKGSLKKSSYGKLPKRGLSMFARAS